MAKSGTFTSVWLIAFFINFSRAAEPQLPRIHLENISNKTYISETRDLEVTCSAPYRVKWDYTPSTQKVPLIRVRNRREQATYTTILKIENAETVHQGRLTCYKSGDKDVKESVFVFFSLGAPSKLLSEDSQQIIIIRQKSRSVLIPCLISRPLIDSGKDRLQLFHHGKQVANAKYDPTKGFEVELPNQYDSRYRETFECRLFQEGGRIWFDQPDNMYVQTFALWFDQGVTATPAGHRVHAKSNEKLNLSCAQAGSKQPLKIIQWRPYDLSSTDSTMNMLGTNATREITAPNFKSRDPRNPRAFACAKLPSDKEFGIDSVEILHHWQFREAKPARLELNYMKKRNAVQCISNNPADARYLIMRIADCLSVDQCAWITDVKDLNFDLSQNVNRTEKAKMANLATTTSQNSVQYAGWTNLEEDEQKLCGCRGNTACVCYEYEVKHTGLVRCLLNENNCDDGGSSDACMQDTTFVISGFEEQDKTILDGANQCFDKASASNDTSETHLYFQGRCTNVFERNATYTIQCLAVRALYDEDFQWVINNGAGLRQGGSTNLNGRGEGHRGYNFSVSEKIEPSRIISELRIHTGPGLQAITSKFTVTCVATGAESGQEERIVSTVTFAALRTSNYIAKDCEPVKSCDAKGETIYCYIGEDCRIDCEPNNDLYPHPTFSWFRRRKNNCAEGEDFSSRFNRSRRFEGSLLVFKAFQQQQVGTYFCRSTIKGQDDFHVCKLRYFEVVVGSDTWILGLALGLVALVGIIAGGAAIFYHIRFKQEQTRANMLSDREVYEFINGNKAAINEELDLSEQAHLLPYENSFEYPFEKLSIGKQLGAGAYGTVVRAEAPDIIEDGLTTTVAVKTVHANADLTYFKALLKELKVMIHIGCHLNVVNLLGACTVNLKHREIYIIVEFCCYGNLQHYMHRYRKQFVNQIVNGQIDVNIRPPEVHYTNLFHDKPSESSGELITLDSSGSSAHYQNTDSGGSSFLDTGGSNQPLWRSNVQGDFSSADKIVMTTTTLVNWCFQIAKGMEYLALKKVFHGDLAARNILLAEGGIAKVADFGLARQVYQDVNYVKKEKCPLPVKWMALESLLRLEFSSQSDVWAYGILLWEIYTLGHVPYPGIEVDSKFVERLQEGTRLDKPTFATDNIYDMMKKCWQEDPSERPTFSDISDYFQKHLVTLDANDYERVCTLQATKRPPRRVSESGYENVPQPKAKKKISFE